MMEIKNIESVKAPSVANFYVNKSVLITGVTGFLGKVFLEKLLYSCKDIDNIFVLIRHKSGVCGQQRVQKLLEKSLFSRLRKEKPEYLKKIIPISGDITKSSLDISAADENIILDTVSIVFHLAATIRFNEELDVTIKTNFLGTKNVLKLSRRIKNIERFIYVSTAYCQIDKEIIEECVYPSPAPFDEVHKYLQEPGPDEKGLDTFLSNFPNTYTFSKGLAEAYVAENHGHIPTVIIRPSIVTASMRDPIPGWNDNWNGATGILTACFKGSCRVLYGDSRNIMDLTPVDFVANLMIVAATTGVKGVSVYNSASSASNPITIKQLYETSKNAAMKININGMYPSMIFTKRMFTFQVVSFLLEKIPAHVVDMYLRLIRKKPRYSKIQKKVDLARGLVNHFTGNSWIIKTEKAQALYTSLSFLDQSAFPFDPISIGWMEYIDIFIRGIKTFLAIEY